MDPVEPLSALLPQRSWRAPYLAALGAMLMVLAPLLALALIPTAQTQERPHTAPPMSAAELETAVRSQIERNGSFAILRYTLGKNGGYVQVTPLPVQWAVTCNGGLLALTVGAPDHEGYNQINLFPPVLTDADCVTSAVAAARVVHRILD